MIKVKVRLDLKGKDEKSKVEHVDALLNSKHVLFVEKHPGFKEHLLVTLIDDKKLAIKGKLDEFSKLLRA